MAATKLQRVDRDIFLGYFLVYEFWVTFKLSQLFFGPSESRLKTVIIIEVAGVVNTIKHQLI